jgi:sigma-B regulation protein RsbU (phosphoserine phosphatase)
VPFLATLQVYFNLSSIDDHPGVILDHLGDALVTNSLLFMVTGIWIWVLVSTNLSRPFASIIRTLNRVREGRLDHRVRVTSNDEIGYTGDVINQMTAGLRERERLRLSMLLAREVQQNLLPTRPPEVRGLDLAGTSRYCDETGGDYFDFLAVAEGSGHRLGVVVGDVAGHGVSSALLMASARASLRQRAALPGGLDDIVADVNGQLCRDVAASGQFMTLFALLVDPDRARIEWVRAGHDPAVLYDPAAERFEELAGAGLPLGVAADGKYTLQHREGLADGTIVLLGTDGIWETFNARGEMFGKERLLPIIRDHARAAAGRIRDRILEALQDFRGTAALADDITLVIVKLNRDRPGPSAPAASEERR